MRNCRAFTKISYVVNQLKNSLAAPSFLSGKQLVCLDFQSILSPVFDSTDVKLRRKELLVSFRRSEIKIVAPSRRALKTKYCGPYRLNIEHHSKCISPPSVIILVAL